MQSKLKYQYTEMVHGLTCVANCHFVNVVTAPCLLFPAHLYNFIVLTMFITL